MQQSREHQVAEIRFRRLIASAGLDPPDGVDYEPESLVFRWSGPKLAVVVDLAAPPEAA